jgi:uncharacterized membrane protein YbaN (DUF454 family)
VLRHLQLVAGFALIIAGLIGIVLPIIPGIPMLIAGVALLGSEHPLVRPFARRFERWRKRNKDPQVTEKR